MAEAPSPWILVDCERCDGTGIVCFGRGENYFERSCKACDGTGKTEGLASDYIQEEIDGRPGSDG